MKTARGREVDMNAIIKANEDMKALGNVPMNARGDHLNEKGEIVMTAAEMDAEQEKNRKEAMPKEPPVTITRKIKKRRNGSRYVEISDGKNKKVFDIEEPEDTIPFIVLSNKNGNVVQKEAHVRSDKSMYFEFQNADGSMDVLELGSPS